MTVIPSRTLGDVRREFCAAYAAQHSWRKVGKIYHLQPSMARLIALTSYQPGRKVAAILGVAPRTTAHLVVIVGEIPAGTQVIQASQCTRCQAYFISNHPRRKLCFICSPFKGKKSLN